MKFKILLIYLIINYIYALELYELLNITNNYRNNAGLNILKWDDILAEHVKKHISNDHFCNSTKIYYSSDRAHVDKWLFVGQNLWKSKFIPSSNIIIDTWYNEIFCYNYGYINAPCTYYNKNKCNSTYTTNHFTQLMIDSITHTGCAIYFCNNNYVIAGCEYSSTYNLGSNFVGSLPFNSTISTNLGLSDTPCS